MGPIDYSSQVQSPFQSVLQGYQGGAAIRNDVLQQQAYQAAQQQAVVQRQMQARVLDGLITNKNSSYEDYARAITLLPGQEKSLKAAWEVKNEGQQASYLKDVGQIYSAIQADRPDIAVQKLNDRAAQLAAAGGDKREIDVLKAQAQAIQASPDSARAVAGIMLAGTPGGKEMFANLSSMGKEQRESAKFPTELRKDRAEATTAEATAGIKTVEAANAPTRVGLENANVQSTIQDREAGQEIARGQLGVTQANAETSRGGLVNEQQKLAATVGEKKQGEALAAQDALDSANALVAQIKGVQNHPGLNAGTGTMSGIRSYFNSTDANDFRKSVEGLKSPVFLNELGKLKAAGITLGQVTEAEGKKLEQRIANLDPDQSTPSFKNQVGILLKDTEKFIDKIKAGGKLPTTGGAYLMKVPGVGEVREGDINRILQKNPGSTREQVLQYLQSRAGNAPSGATGGF